MFDWFKELSSSIENGIKSGIESGLTSIFESIKSEVEGWLKVPEPGGPFQRIRLFTTTDQPITQACVAVDRDSWRLDAYGERKVELFEIFEPETQESVLLCRAQVKTLKLQKPAELKLTLARSNGYFGRVTSIAETIDWHTCEVPFHFKKERYPGSIKIGVDFKDSGTVWIRNVELLQAPVKVSVQSDSTGSSTCPLCHGSGEQRKTEQHGSFGEFIRVSKCPTCGGTGKVN